MSIRMMLAWKVDQHTKMWVGAALMWCMGMSYGISYGIVKFLELSDSVMQVEPHTRLSAKFNVAPMIDWTDRHCRFFHRLITRHALLYTEMIVADAILRGDRDYLLKFDAAEHPIALQIGGSDPAKLAAAAQIGAEYGYDEINLNVGCPSDRVQSGTFGACLMAQPKLVAQCYRAMAEVVDIPVTIKCRIGIDDQDVPKTLPHFIETVADAGCDNFIIHARKAWLKGLSPKENRTIPPLDYPLVEQMAMDYPQLTIVLNGGVLMIDECLLHLENFDGVMVGRAAYENPYLLHEVDAHIYGDAQPPPSRHEVARKMVPYIKEQIAHSHERIAKIKAADPNVRIKPLRAHNITRHMIGLFHGQPGARGWRQTLTVEASKPEADETIIEQALAQLPVADVAPAMA